MPSFDVVSKLNLQEVDNAFNQTQKEIITRYDFKNTDTELTREDKVITIKSATEDRLKMAVDVMYEKLVKRGVSLKFVEAGEILPTAKGHSQQILTMQDGIVQEKAKLIVKAIKESKLKVQGSIQGDSVRVTGKNKDDLQSAMQLLRGQDFEVELQFNNFRD